MSDEPNEVSIPLQAHNLYIYWKRKSYISRTKLPLIWNIDFQRIKGGFNFSEIFQNFSNLSFCM